MDRPGTFAVLVLSTFTPKAQWKAELAMARNPIIYGLAAEIYVAESSEKGGTWSGVIDGLRRGRKIFVRKPEADEKNANNLLIEKGAIPVDFEGASLHTVYDTSPGNGNNLAEESPEQEILEDKIRKALNGKSVTAADLLTKLQLTWTKQRLSTYLKNLDFVEVVKKSGKSLYKLKGTMGTAQKELF